MSRRTILPVLARGTSGKKVCSSVAVFGMIKTAATPWPRLPRRRQLAFGEEDAEPPRSTFDIELN
jgi:hypothetical protein